jgi:hypothetical protein
MYDLPHTGGGNIPEPELEPIKAILAEFKSSVGQQANLRGLPLGQVPALRPCNLLVVLTNSKVHVAFTDKNAGGLPRKHHSDQRSVEFTAEHIRQAAINELHFELPSVISFDAALVSQAPITRAPAIASAAAAYVEEQYKEFKRMKAPAGFEQLQPSLDRFFVDHPDYEKNVFVMMRFRTAVYFKEIHNAIVSGLAKHGLKGHRADDRIYPEDDDLWNNICVYLAGCKYGIAVFEDFDEREFNPNVPLEYGVMRAWGKRVLLLKEQRMPKLPSDVTGKLYKSFDMMQIEQTVHAQIDEWVKRDLRI